MNSSLILIIVTIVAMIVAEFRLSERLVPCGRKWSVSLSVTDLFSHGKKASSLMDFINDFSHGFVFFSVGLKSKEILVGELSTLKKPCSPSSRATTAAWPSMLIFFLTCPDDALMLRGTAIPMATDIAFSTEVLSMFGKQVPIGLKIFLATLAVADDLTAFWSLPFSIHPFFCNTWLMPVSYL